MKIDKDGKAYTVGGVRAPHEDRLDPVAEIQRRLDAFHSPSFDREIVEKLIAGYRSQAERIAALEVERDGLNRCCDTLNEDADRWHGEFLETRTAKEAAESLLAEAREQQKIGHEMFNEALKRGLNDLRAHASRGPVSSREIFTLTDPLIDMIARSEAAPSGQAPLEGVDAELMRRLQFGAENIGAELEAEECREIVSALLPASAEPVAEVIWFDPQLRTGPERAGKIIDASIAFIEDSPIGTKLYASPPASGPVEAGWPRGARFNIEHDGFFGTVIGHYERLDGKRGVVGQMDGTNIVHVYGEKWLSAASTEGKP